MEIRYELNTRLILVFKFDLLNSRLNLNAENLAAIRSALIQQSLSKSRSTQVKTLDLFMSTH